jgi:DMSO/TMAO reductase YedYZ molybdopterin-dependent catalytic subunit
VGDMAIERRSKLSRRQLLKNSLATGFLLTGFPDFGLLAAGLNSKAGGSEENRLLAGIDFAGEGFIPMNIPMGSGLDGRLYTDLSAVGPDRRNTPTDKFYLRTRASDLLEEGKPWMIGVTGLNKHSRKVGMAELRKMAKPAGSHLMECSGNVRAGHFGMLSVADWAGVPVSKILESVGIDKALSRVLISGFDHYSIPSNTSEEGASWIFTVEELNSSRAFLATEMNGASLTKDHGAPVRLVVPGWYGCSCIKWVNEIALVAEDAAVTSQMKEFASRTMQEGEPGLARDYHAAVIEQAAMPTRIEKWLVQGKITYRLHGIAWGGSRPAGDLEISFNPGEDFVQVDDFQQTVNDPWSFWTHQWAPKQPGSYSIQLRVKDRSIPSRRLDAGYYVRSIEISEI